MKKVVCAVRASQQMKTFGMLMKAPSYSVDEMWYSPFLANILVLLMTIFTCVMYVILLVLAVREDKKDTQRVSKVYSHKLSVGGTGSDITGSDITTSR